MNERIARRWNDRIWTSQYRAKPNRGYFFHVHWTAGTKSFFFRLNYLVPRDDYFRRVLLKGECVKGLYIFYMTFFHSLFLPPIKGICPRLCLGEIAIPLPNKKFPPSNPPSVIQNHFLPLFPLPSQRLTLFYSPPFISFHLTSRSLSRVKIKKSEPILAENHFLHSTWGAENLLF